MVSVSSCLICGKPLKPDRKAYCSRKCYAISKCGIPPRNKIGLTMTCEVCGTVYPTTPSAIKNNLHNYCSRACFHKAHAINMVGKGRKRIPKVCEMCGKPYEVIPSWEKTSKSRFCSYECSYAWKRTIRGPGHPLWTSVSRTCQVCGKQFYCKATYAKKGWGKYCSRKCHNAVASPQIKSPTSIEIKINKLLTSMGLAFEQEKVMGPFRCDFVLKDRRLAIECDGTYWHGNDLQQQKDARKDSWLMSHGYKILRLPEDKINHNLDGCKYAILAFL